MARDLLNRYIWIIDTIRRYGRISRRELNECWERSPYSDGEREIPRRTFFNYRIAIEELFSLTIECDPRTYEYYIVEPDKGRITDWLLDSSATSSVLQGSREIASKIPLRMSPPLANFSPPSSRRSRSTTPSASTTTHIRAPIPPRESPSSPISCASTDSSGMSPAATPPTGR